MVFLSLHHLTRSAVNWPVIEISPMFPFSHPRIKSVVNCPVMEIPATLPEKDELETVA